MDPTTSQPRTARFRLALAALLVSVLPLAPVLADDAEGAGWSPDDGLTVEGLVTVDLCSAFGPDRAGGGVARGLLDLGLNWELGGPQGADAGRLFVFVHGLRGKNGSDHTGDLQGHSNIDDQEFEDFAEVGYQKSWRDGRFALRVGRLDANATFAVVEHGGDFVHSSPGFSPTILTLVTYPNPGAGLELTGDTGAGIDWKVGLFESPLDGDSLNRERNPLLALGELGRQWALGGGGRLGVGVWSDSARLSRFDGGVRSGTSGLYAVFDQNLGKPASRIGLFAQWGQADGSVSEFESHIGLGLTRRFQGGRRGPEQCGAMVSRVDLSDRSGAGFVGNETAVEAFCDFPLHPLLRLKPDLQWIRNPGGDPTREDTWVAILRIQLSFDGKLGPQ